MNFTAGLFSDDIYWFAHYPYLLIVLAALYRAPWSRLRQPQQLHLFLGTVVGFMLLWSMKAGINPGLSFHLLGGTLLTLMFGWELAILALSLTLLGVTLSGGLPWLSFSLNALTMIVLPVMFSHLLYRLSVRYLPHHFFVYVLFNGYLGGALAMTLTVSTASLLMACCSNYSSSQLLHLYLPFAPFMAFAEAFFTGMLVAGLVLFHPEWIPSFDDRLYLKGK